MDFTQRARELIGEAHVLTGTDTAGFASDFTGKYQGTPLCVLRPANRDEVAALLRLAQETRTPVVPVGGNTGLVGGTYTESAALLSLARLNRIRDIAPGARVATVEAGVILSRLHDAAAEHDLIFPLTFGAKDSAMIGGVLATNAGGSNVLRYGNTRALVLGLEAVTAEGEVLDLLRPLHKDNSGYDLRDLLIGSEGTLAIITAASLRLFPRPPAYGTAMLATPDLPAALRVLNRLQAATSGAVEAFEFMPRSYIEAHLNTIDGAREPFEKPHEINILAEIGGHTDALETALEAAFEAGDVTDAVIAQSEAQRIEMWTRREAAAEVVFHQNPLVAADIALPLDQIDRFFADVRPQIATLDPAATDLCVAHLGDGNLHYNVYSECGAAEEMTAIVEETAVRLGGTFSAEHGVGLSKLDAMTRHKNPVALKMMWRVKAAFDPNNILNPGKVLPD